MSLNQTQIENTIKELRTNFELTGLTKEQVMADLNISALKFDNIMNLDQQALEDPWIMRNYLLKKVVAAGNEPIPFTALRGDYTKYSFLDSKIIDDGKISFGDF